MTSRMIKLFDPVTNNEEIKATMQVLKSKFWASGSGQGEVKKFENNFKRYTNSKECIAVNNGTAALHLAISLFDIRNKEVIIPSLSFVSTAHAVLYNGGKPVFADIEPTTACIDPKDIEKKITKKTAMVIPVHFAGMPAKLDEIKKICKNKNLILIEDAAHAAGSKFQGKKIGSIGEAVCFSFHPVKNLAMPTGGAICINHKKSKQIAKELYAKRWCGITNRHGMNYQVNEIGWNYYMNEFSAAIGNVQLKKLDNLNSARVSIAKQYNVKINSEKKMPFDTNSSYHFYWILVEKRAEFMKFMNENRIETGIHYNPIHKMNLYKKSKQSLPNTEEIAGKIVSLPTHPNLKKNDIKKIIDCVNEFLHHS